MISPVVNSALLGVFPTSSQYFATPTPLVQENVAVESGNVAPGVGELIWATVAPPQLDAALYAYCWGGRCQSVAPLK